MRWNPDLCKRGHHLTRSNTYQRPRGPRECRTCRKERHHHQWITRTVKPRQVVKPRVARAAVVAMDWPDYDGVPL